VVLAGAAEALGEGMRGLEGKNVLIIGRTSGIGQVRMTWNRIETAVRVPD
jgi:hypothetical protein